MPPYLDKTEYRKFKRFADEQTVVLQQHFAKEKYLTKEMLMKLSEQLRLNERQFYNWFKNARRKLKGGKIPESSKSKYVYMCKTSGITVKCSFAQ